MNIIDPQELAIYIATGYTKWAKEKQQATADEIFQMVLNYVAVMDLYRAF